MADRTKIEWSDATWNPIVGCSLVSPGCTNCYAMRAAYRIEKCIPDSRYQGVVRLVNGRPVWSGTVKLAPLSVLEQPLRWRRPRRVFVNSMADLFHETVPDAWIDAVFAVIANCPHHTFQVLTKRSGRMRTYLDGIADEGEATAICRVAAAATLSGIPTPKAFEWPLRNCWFGVSVEDQTRADERIPDLLKAPATVRFVSAEPLLGPLEFRQTFSPASSWDWLAGERSVACGTSTTARIDWVLAGGESGPGARPMNPEWARSLRDQCAAAATPFFFKQFGAFAPVGPARQLVARSETPLGVDHLQNNVFLSIGRDGLTGEHLHQVGKKAAGRALDGAFHDDWPKGVAMEASLS